MLKKSMFSFIIKKLLLSHLAIDKKTKVSLIDWICFLYHGSNYDGNSMCFLLKHYFTALAFKSFRIQSTPLLH